MCWFFYITLQLKKIIDGRVDYKELGIKHLQLSQQFLVDLRDRSTTYGYVNYPIYLTAVGNFKQYMII